MANIPLRVLIIEDSENDTLLLVRELKRGGYEPAYERVDTPEAMSAALDRQPWDIIISDYVMPSFSGLDALKLMQSKGLDLPFIIVSGKIGEDVAVDSMKAGAGDYVMKDNLARLVPAVERELREAKVRRERRRAEEALAEERRLFIAGPTIVFRWKNAEGWPVEYVSPNVEAQFGYSPKDLTSGKIGYASIIHPDDLDRVAREVRTYSEAGLSYFEQEYRIRRADGEYRWLYDCTMVVRDSSGKITGYQGYAMDITERKLAEQREREVEAHKREFYRRTILSATEGKLVIADYDEIQQIAGPPAATWMIDSIEALGTIRSEAAALAGEAGMEQARIADFEICIGEAVTNAYKHAGGGMASIHRVNDSLVCVVSDKGRGIEVLALPEVALKRGYTTAMSLGMGYKMIISLADQVYLATGPEGTTVAIRMRLRPVERPLIPAGMPDAWGI
ncbi:MAG: PAS domain-containing protein [Armatimonadota bacterium]